MQARTSNACATDCTPGSIESVLCEHVTAARKGIVRGRIVGAVLLAAVATWLTWLHGQIASLDADGMTALAKAKALERMPGAIAALQERVEGAAPEVLDRASQRVLELPALLRERLDAEADVLIARAQDAVRIGFAEHVDLDLAGARAEIEARYPGMDEREQLRTLVHDWAHEYRAAAWDVMSAPAGRSEQLCGEIAAEIEHLGRNQSLTQEERIQREILCTLAALAPRLESVEMASYGSQLAELELAWER